MIVFFSCYKTGSTFTQIDKFSDLSSLTHPLNIAEHVAQHEFNQVLNLFEKL